MTNLDRPIYERAVDSLQSLGFFERIDNMWCHFWSALFNCMENVLRDSGIQFCIGIILAGTAITLCIALPMHIYYSHLCAPR